MGGVMINHANYFGGVNIFFAPGMGRVSSKLVGQNKYAPALPPPLIFDRSLRTFGLPTRMQCDHGTENIEVARFMLNAHGVEGSHVLTALSVHNQPIERLWVDVVRYIVTPYRNIFSYLESFRLLDPLKIMSYICLHCTLFTNQGSTKASRNLFCCGITIVCLRRDAKHPCSL